MSTIDFERAQGSTFPAVASNTFLLIPQTVTDLDHFTGNRSEYLVSIYDEPERAASLWRERLKRNPYGDEGFVSIEHYGRELIAGDLWDQVSGIWNGFVGAIGQYLTTGEGEAWFAGQPVPIMLRRQRRTVLLTVHRDTCVVDPATFFPGVLNEADRFLRWVDEYIGVPTGGEAKEINRVRKLLPFEGS